MLVLNSARRLRPIAVLAAVCVLSGCAITTHPYGVDVGVELEPLAPGWKDNLRMKAHGQPGQFVWRDGPFSVEIVNWLHPDEATYFMVYVRNKGDVDAQIRVRRPAGSDAAPGLGAFDVFSRSGFRRSGKHVDETQWIELPAGGMVEFWIDDLAWLSEPAMDDLVSCEVDIDAAAAALTCPVAFRVARVYRQP